jgi:hypothetical protein
MARRATGTQLLETSREKSDRLVAVISGFFSERATRSTFGMQRL